MQTARKETGLEYVDRIRLAIEGSPRVRGIVEKHRDALAAEVLATEIATTLPEGATVIEVDVEGEAIRIAITRVT